MDGTSLADFFNSNYMPHGHCYMWQPHILWTNVIADLLIAVAYFSIPIAIVILARKRPDIGYQRVAFLFSAFILFCGITHIFGIITIWQGIYGWHGVFKSLTAIVSITTAVYLYKILPALVHITTPEQVEGIRSELNSVSAQKEQLSSLVEEQKLVQFMLDSIPIGACLLGNNYQVLHCNETFANEIKSSKTNIINKPIAGLLADNNSANKLFLKSLENQQAYPQTTETTKHKGIVHFLQGKSATFPAEVSLVKKQFNNVDYTVFTMKNLTEIEEIKRQLLQSHKKLESAINATEDGIWELQLPQYQMDCSETFKELIGKDLNFSLSFEHWLDHIHNDHRPRVTDAIEKFKNKRERFSIEYLGLNTSDEYGWFNLVGKTSFDRNGKAIFMSGSLRYVQDQKELQQEVTEKSELLNTIYEGANNAIWVVSVEEDCQFKFITFNRTAKARLEVGDTSVIGSNILDVPQDVIPSDVAARINDHLQACVDVRKTIEYTEMIPFDGKPFWYHTSLYPILDEQEQIVKIVGSSIDITSQKEVEKQLSDNKQRLENIIDASVCGLSLFDLELQKTTRINQRFEDILGYTLEEFQAVENQLGLYHPDDIHNISAHIELVIGSPDDRLLSIKYRQKHKNGTWRWCSAYTTIIKRDANNTPKIMLTTFIDITDEVALLEKLTESNSYLERFAMVASHDLQEPLRKINSFSELLSERLVAEDKLDEESDFLFSRIKESASRMRVMITDILSLSQINSVSLQRRQFQLKDVVESACDQLQLVIEEQQAQVSVINEEALLFADKSLFIQLFQNLIGNAIKFRSEQRPLIEIKAEKSEISTTLYIRDNGIGMDPSFCNQIFEPFRRLHGKDKYKGSGIGLAICKQICTVHDGTIKCQSEPGVGTTFIINLPL